MAEQQARSLKIAVVLYRHDSGQPVEAPGVVFGPEGPNGALHCALLAQEDHLPFSLPVKVYQISNLALGSNATKQIIVPWYTNHMSGKRLLETGAIRGCILLGRTEELTMEEFDGLIEESCPARQGSWQLPGIREHWDCSWWVFRSVEMLCIMGYLNLKLHDALGVYQTVAGLGALVDLKRAEHPGKLVIIDFETREAQYEG